MNFTEATSGAHVTVSGYTVEASYFRDRLDFFATKYSSQFDHWSKFFAAYTRKELSHDNLDYDEWAFLCDQMLYEQTESSPPDSCLDSKERPDIDSGLFIWRIGICSTPKPISIA